MNQVSPHCWYLKLVNTRLKPVITALRSTRRLTPNEVLRHGASAEPEPAVNTHKMFMSLHGCCAGEA